MPRPCPLCGKPKPEEALFCDDCARKIHTEYEVGIPGDTGRERAPANEDMPAKGDPYGPFADSPLSHEESNSGDGFMANDLDVGGQTAQDRVVAGGMAPKRRKRPAAPILFLLAAALLVGAFFVYNSTIRKSNLDRSGWDAAVKANTSEGYLAYMEAHPRGAHFDEAQAGLRRLKVEEAAAWERMKESDNVAGLRDFLERHANSPYVPLVKTRLDSLIWAGAMQMNTPESYSDYIMLAENGGIGGDYIAEARKRHDLLSATQPGDTVVLGGIRATVGGFFSALSALDHDGMVRYLAPVVYRFFNSGAATRERIAGELLVTGARTEGATLEFTPDTESLRYEVTGGNHYKVNVPLRKSYPKDGATEEVYGYIAHIEMDTLYQITGIYETKPYPEAP